MKTNHQFPVFNSLLSCYFTTSQVDIVSPDFDVVRQQPAVNGLGGVSHERSSFEAGLLQEPGQSSAVIQVEAEGGARRTCQLKTKH